QGRRRDDQEEAHRGRREGRRQVDLEPWEGSRPPAMRSAGRSPSALDAINSGIGSLRAFARDHFQTYSKEKFRVERSPSLTARGTLDHRPLADSEGIKEFRW